MAIIQRVAQISAASILVCSAVGSLPARTFAIDVPAAEPPNMQESPIDEIRQVAAATGIAANDLLAISAQESSLGKFTSGDNGCSRGWFHINLCVWDAADLIGNIAAEARWVAAKLNEYGYAADRVTAIARYNAPARPNYDYAAQVQKRLGELKVFLRPYETVEAETR